MSSPERTAVKDVLIYAHRETVAHKLAGEVPDDEVCFWTVNGTPQQTGPGAEVLFTDGQCVHAHGAVIDVEHGRLWFEPLEPCEEEVPCKPVTRGFRYVDR